MLASELLDSYQRSTATVCCALQAVAGLFEFVPASKHRDAAVLYLLGHAGEVADELDRRLCWRLQELEAQDGDAGEEASTYAGAQA